MNCETCPKGRQVDRLNENLDHKDQTIANLIYAMQKAIVSTDLQAAREVLVGALEGDYETYVKPVAVVEAARQTDFFKEKAA